MKSDKFNQEPKLVFLIKIIEILFCESSERMESVLKMRAYRKMKALVRDANAKKTS